MCLGFEVVLDLLRLALIFGANLKSRSLRGPLAISLISSLNADLDVIASFISCINLSLLVSFILPKFLSIVLNGLIILFIVSEVAMSSRNCAKMVIKLPPPAVTTTGLLY